LAPITKSANGKETKNGKLPIACKSGAVKFLRIFYPWESHPIKAKRFACPTSPIIAFPTLHADILTVMETLWQSFIKNPKAVNRDWCFWSDLHQGADYF
jgi:hypothetical protein